MRFFKCAKCEKQFDEKWNLRGPLTCMRGTSITNGRKLFDEYNYRVGGGGQSAH